MAEQWDGRVALVTGAVTDIDFSAAQAVATSITGNGYRAIAVGLEVANEADWGVGQAAVEADARLISMGGAGSLRTAAGVDLVDTPAFPEVAKPESLGFREAPHDRVDPAPADLVWTVVSPPAAIEVDGASTGTYRTADDELVVDAEGASRISAADLAVAVVDEVENSKHPRRVSRSATDP